MKKTKIIIPALGLLVLSTAASVSGTVAWFSANTSVSATGMVVKAQSSSTLLIDTASTLASNGRLAAGASTKAASTAMAGDGISPTSTVDGTNWFTATAAASNDEAAISGSYVAVAENQVTSYRLANTFYLQAFDATKAKAETYDAFTGKQVVIDKMVVTYTAADNLNSSFRVLAVCGSSKVFCAPTAATARTNQGVASVSDGVATKSNITYATSSYASATNTATLSANNIVLSSLNYNQVYEVNIYLYFDGEDETCFTDNIPDVLNNYTVEVSFSLVTAA